MPLLRPAPPPYFCMHLRKRVLTCVYTERCLCSSSSSSFFLFLTSPFIDSKEGMTDSYFRTAGGTHRVRMHAHAHSCLVYGHPRSSPQTVRSRVCLSSPLLSDTPPSVKKDSRLDFFLSPTFFFFFSPHGLSVVIMLLFLPSHRFLC